MNIKQTIDKTKRASAHIIIPLIALFILIAIPASAEYKLRHIDAQLSNNAVLYTYQDTDGYMWFGTYDGLNLYNGKEVITYRYEEGNPFSLCSNIIFKISPAGKDHIWISTSLGLNKFSLDNRSVTESYTEYPMAMLIVSDEWGNTWMISKGNTISFYNKDESNPRFREIPIDNSSVNSADVNQLFIYHDKLCIITYDGRLLVLSCEDFRKGRKLKIKETRIHDSEIYRCHIKDEQLYYIDRKSRIYQYNLETSNKQFLMDIAPNINNTFGYISQITVFEDDIYIAFKNKGVMRLNILGKSGIQEINPETPVFCMLPDRYQNILWIGTDGQGVQQYSQTTSLFGQITNEDISLINKPIRSLYTDKYNNLWIGTNGSGILRIREANKMANRKVDKKNIDSFTSDNGLANNQVFCFERSKDKDIFWIGSERPGLSYYSYSDNKMRVVINKTKNKVENIHSIKEVNDSTLFIASACCGIIKVITEKVGIQYYIKSATNTSLQTASGNICNEFHSMSYDKQNHLMIGCRGGYGVARYNITNDEYNFIPIAGESERSAIGDVLCVHQSTDSIFYIGSSSGILKMQFFKDGKTSVKQFNKKSGLVNDMIHGILEDNEGYIWFSTNRGLVKYNPQNDSFHNFIAPLLKTSEFSDDAYWKCPYLGRLYFGGINGFVWIDNNKGIKESPAPNFHFFDMKIAKESIPLSQYMNKKNKAVEIPPSVQTFTISFIAVDFTNNNNYEYAYKLENYNDSWIDLNKNNEVTFTNLPYGEYVLKVKCKNDVVSGTDHIYSLLITKLPPWYLTKLAYAIYLLVAVLFCVYIIYSVKQRIAKRNRRILHKIEEEQRRELFESKLKFFTNITHEFYTPLTLIKGTCESMKNMQSGRFPEYDKYIDILYNNADDLEKLIQEILKFRQLEEVQGEIHVKEAVDITTHINRFLQPYALIAKQSDIDLQIYVQNNIRWNTDLACFNKIMSNLISNAFKYTPADGIIKVTAEIKDNNLTFSVYNTGKGIDESKIASIFNRYNVLEDVASNKYSQLTSRTGLGLSICSSMVKLLNGNITVESKVNEFTLFNVILPPLEAEHVYEAENSKEEETPKSNIINLQSSKAANSQILIVDDNKDIVWMIADVLSDSYTIFKAYDAEEALDILAKQNISLIITDIMMPGIDGIELVNRIKANRIIKHIPLIIISAKVTDQQQQEGIQAGADVYLPKPFSLSLLKSHVDRLILNKEELKNYYRSPESAYEYTEGNIVHQEERQLIDRIVSIIDQNITNPQLGPDFIAETLNINTRTLYRKVKQMTSLSLADFIKNYRFIFAENLLVTTNLTIQEIMFKVGISNKSYFYREFLKKNGVTPKEFRNTKKE